MKKGSWTVCRFKGIWQEKGGGAVFEGGLVDTSMHTMMHQQLLLLARCFNCCFDFNSGLENTIYQIIVLYQHSLLTEGLLKYTGLHNPDNDHTIHLIQTQKYIVFSLKIRNILYLLRRPVCAFYHFNCTLKNYFSLALGFIILGLIVAANFHLTYCFVKKVATSVAEVIQFAG